MGIQAEGTDVVLRESQLADMVGETDEDDNDFHHPDTGAPIQVKTGRYGPYVTDGETNASIGKGDRIEEMSPARAFELLGL